MFIITGLLSPYGTMTARQAVWCTTASFILGLAFLVYFFFPNFGTMGGGLAGETSGTLSLGYTMTSFMLLCGWMRYCILAKRARAEGISQVEVWKHLLSFFASGFSQTSLSTKNEQRFSDIVYGDNKGFGAFLWEGLNSKDSSYGSTHVENFQDEDLVRRAAELKANTGAPASRGNISATGRVSSIEESIARKNALDRTRNRRGASGKPSFGMR